MSKNYGIDGAVLNRMLCPRSKGCRKITVLKDALRPWVCRNTTFQEIPYTDPRVIFYIPEQEIILNPKLEQNP